MGKKTTKPVAGDGKQQAKDGIRGEAAPTNLRTLAAHLNLSQAAVSLILNDSPAARSIPQHTRDRVIEAAAHFGYRPNYFARSLRKSRSMSVGVLTPDLSEGYFTLVMNGIQESLMHAHYFYFTANHYWKQELIEKYPLLLMERAVDGFLLLNTPAPFRIPLPVVSISGHQPMPGVTNIVLDHRRAAELALGHLYQLGHREIAFMRGPSVISDSEYRWEEIMRVAAELRIPVKPKICLTLETSSSSPEMGYGPMAKLLAETNGFTALFCFNDISAIGAMAAIKDAGLTVPKDVSVIGFDDIMAAAFQGPKLTTVRQPLREMGSQGAEILLRKIQYPSENYPDTILVEPDLVIRESTGPARRRAKS